MEGKGPEFSPNISETTDKGFSEKRAARIIEGKQTDNSQVKKRKAVVQSSRQKAVQRAARTIMQKEKNTKRAARRGISLREKIIEAYERNSQEIQRLVKSFTVLSHGSFATSEELMMQMRARQHIQEELLNVLALESQGQLTEETLSKELADLIK